MLSASDLKGILGMMPAFAMPDAADIRATQTIAGVRPCTTVTLASRKRAARRAGSDRRAHNGCWLFGRSRCLTRRRSSSGTSMPPADATVAEPPAAITACAASSVVRARLPPASDGTI